MANAKILLINPEIHQNRYYGSWKNFIYPFLPAELLQTAAYLKQNNLAVKIFDFRIDDDFSKLMSVVKDFNPDFVSFFSLTFLIDDIFFAAQKIKEFDKNITTLVTGYNACANPLDLISNKYVDFAIQGQTPKTILNLITATTQNTPINTVENIVFLKNGKEIKTREIKTKTDLNYLPTPTMSLELIDLEKYWSRSSLPWAKRFISMYASKGCAFSCNFCLNSQQPYGTYQKMSLEKLFADIDYYIKNYQIDSIIFLDPVFTLDYTRTQKFCAFMKTNNLSWAIQTRADLLDVKLIKELKEAGCKIISMGIETHNDKFLSRIDKKTRKKQITDIVKAIKKEQMTVRASFILGLLGESFFDSLKTIYFALTLPVYSCMFYLNTPYPGTKLWNEFEREIPKDNWAQFSQFAGYTKNPLIFKPKNRFDFELKFLQRAGFVLCHLKPSVLCHILKDYLKTNSPRKIIRAAYTVLKNLILNNT